MSNKPENPAAFPCDFEKYTDHSGAEINTGMALRDYFAAKALIKAMSVAEDIYDITEKDGGFYKCAAQISYQIADAMLAERMKGQQ